MPAIKESRINYRYTKLIEHIGYKKTSFKIERGIQQGDTISPKHQKKHEEVLRRMNATFAHIGLKSV